jgi:RNA polymerase-binding transcription factor DksA
MPDACDFIVDVQLKAADNFTLQRLAQVIAGPLNGDCIDCLFPIPFSRRQALPSADRCFTCQGIHERKGAMYGRA